MNLYRRLARPVLFSLGAEEAHDTVAAGASFLANVPGGPVLVDALYKFERPALRTTVAGIDFPNPIGLAAGFDKDCRMAGILPSLGFGFIEVGTITPRPQPGNPKPRVFRVPEAKAIINRLGFNNHGAAAAAKRLARLGKLPCPLGINIGMNKDTPPEKAVEDYVAAFSALKAFGDYFVVNVSSPNTQGLRDLQDRMKLERILTALRAVNDARKPVFVKIAPDLTFEQLAALVPVVAQEAQGLIVSNTTLSRDGVPERYADVQGGLSGAPLKERSTAMIAEVRRMTRGRVPIIGVGGIFTSEDAYQKLRAGASLVQIYTGLIYRGPSMVRDMKRGLMRILRDQGIATIADAVGRNVELQPESAPS